LDDTDIGKVTPAQSFQILSFAIPLLLLLCKALVILGSDWFELDSIICVDPATCRAALVQIFLDMMPAEATDLITTDTGLKVQIRYVHFFETERTLRVFLKGEGATISQNQCTEIFIKRLLLHHRSNTRPEHRPKHEIWIAGWRIQHARQVLEESGVDEVAYSTFY